MAAYAENGVCAMADISRENRSIRGLLRSKNNVLGRIQTKMALSAYTKRMLTDEQIASFRGFIADYAERAAKVNGVLSEIEEDLALRNMGNRIGGGDANELSAALHEINVRQRDAISALTVIIEHGERTLAFI